eukprot:s149_g26.t1
MGEKRKRISTFSRCCRRRPATVAVAEKGVYCVVRTGLRGKLEAVSSLIQAAYSPCHTSYLDAKGRWNISCYAELDDIPDVMVPGAVVHIPMTEVLQPLLDELTAKLCTWWHSLHPEFSAFELHRVQTFVTRYRPHEGETHLTRHVDGPHVDASFILQLHSSIYTGGGLRIWDAQGRSKDYAIETGDLCMLDHMVWHQSLPVTSGERWVLVVFCQKRELPQPCQTIDAEKLSAAADCEGQHSGPARCQQAIWLATQAANASCDVDKVQATNLVRMLSASSLDERERAAFALGCLAVSGSSNQETIVGSGAVPVLVQMLGTSSAQRSTERAWAAAALGRLAVNCPKNKHMIAHLGAIQPLVAMLLSSQELEAEEAASALCNLSANHEGNKQLMTLANAAPALLKCLGGDSQKQRIWATAALSNLASLPASCRQMRRAGAIERLDEESSVEAASLLEELQGGVMMTDEHMGAAGVERWQCVCKVPLSIRTAPRGKGEIVAVIGPGELVAFTPFPKRPVALSDLSAHSYLRCRKLLEAAEAEESQSFSESEQGWISCNSEDGGVHFIPFAGTGDLGQATWSWKSWFQRSSSQNPVALRWIRENFSVDVASVSSLELAALLEKRTVEETSIQHPVFAREVDAGKLEFAAGKTCLDEWLQQPVECSGNLHSGGLMSLWAWFTQDLARAAIATSLHCQAQVKVKRNVAGRRVDGQSCRSQVMRQLWVAAVFLAALPAAADEALRGSVTDKPSDLGIKSFDVKAGPNLLASDPTSAPSSDAPRDGSDEEDVKARIEAEVEERLKRREEEKQKEEEKDEDTEMTSNFLLFGLLGLAALIRIVCKALPEKENSSYLILQDASPSHRPAPKQNGRVKTPSQPKRPQDAVESKATVSTDKGRRPPAGSR